MFRAALVFTPLALAKPIDHPTLPTMWISTTNDPPMGEGIESYYFTDKPSNAEPSAMWSNYTNCERLLYVGDYEIQTRYLMKCDSVDCCKEDMGQTNQVEFQIPNVHPEALAEKFKHAPNQTVQTEFGEVVCDVWSWEFTAESTEVCTTPCEDCPNNVTLHQWHVKAFEERVSIDFKDFKGIAEDSREDFKGTFVIPKVCTGNILRCPDNMKKPPLNAAERLHKWREEVYAKNGQVAPPLRQ